MSRTGNEDVPHARAPTPRTHSAQTSRDQSTGFSKILKSLRRYPVGFHDAVPSRGAISTRRCSCRQTSHPVCSSFEDHLSGRCPLRRPSTFSCPLIPPLNPFFYRNRGFSLHCPTMRISRIPTIAKCLLDFAIELQRVDGPRGREMATQHHLITVEHNGKSAPAPGNGQAP